jgi:hypothetical protein
MGIRLGCQGSSIPEPAAEAACNNSAVTGTIALHAQCFIASGYGFVSSGNGISSTGCSVSATGLFEPDTRSELRRR